MTAASGLLEAAVEVAVSRAAAVDLEDAAVLLADHLVTAAAGGASGVTTGVGAIGAIAPAIRCAEAAHVDDEDDVHWPSLTHPGGLVWPVVLAMGDGNPQWRAAAAGAGYELLASLSLTHGPEQRLFWQPTATCGSAAIALVACLLTEQPISTSVSACAHALSAGGGSSCAVATRSGSRLVNRTAAVATGLVAADAAMRGLTGTSSILERPDGLIAARTPAGAGPAPSVPPPAQDGVAALSRTSVRLYPGAGFLLPALSAVALLGRVTEQVPLVVTLSSACRRIGEARTARMIRDVASSADLGHARELLRNSQETGPEPRVRLVYSNVLSPQEALAAVDAAGGPAASAHWPRPRDLDLRELASKWCDLLGRDLDAREVLGVARSYLDGRGTAFDVTQFLTSQHH